MKEILYIQAGTVSNYAGTHFWNAQQEYLDGGSLGSEVNSEDLVNHEISFQERYDTQRKSTIYCPRVLIFDHKSGIGLVPQIGAEWVDIEDSGALWDGEISEEVAPAIDQSEYQEFLEKEEAYCEDPANVDPPVLSPESFETNIRYWSDYSRIYYSANSVQVLPDRANSELDGSWASGAAVFEKYNEESVLVEGSLRTMLEECDSPQGLQITSDTSPFGPFIASLLTQIRDEGIKLPSIAFPLISNTIPPSIASKEDRLMVNHAISDAFYLRSLDDLSSISMPIQSPSKWSSLAWQNLTMPKEASTYHMSAILATHIENCTLPLRLKGTREDVPLFAAQLNWRNCHKFAQVSGTFPNQSMSDSLSTGMYNFSKVVRYLPEAHFAYRDVTRGFSKKNIEDYTEWRSTSGLPSPLGMSNHAFPSPKPSSLPTFLRGQPSATALPKDSISDLQNSITSLSSLATTPGMGIIFKEYATFTDRIAKQGSLVLLAGSESDEIRELANDLWTIHDNYAGDEIDYYESIEDQ